MSYSSYKFVNTNTDISISLGKLILRELKLQVTVYIYINLPGLVETMSRTISARATFFASQNIVQRL